MQQDFELKVRRFDAALITAYRNNHFDSVEADLHDLLQTASTVDERYAVLGMFANHFHFTRNGKLAKQAIQDQIALLPERSEGWLGLTEHAHYHDVDLEEAAHNVEIALQKAIAENMFVRQVLGVRMRIAMEQANYELANESLASLLNFTPTPGTCDVALESDFLTREAARFLREDLVSAYKARLNSRK